MSGPFSGRSRFDLATPRCSFVHQTYDARYTTANGSSGSFHLDGCVDITVNGFSYVGTFVLTKPKGGELRGRVAGTGESGDTTTPCPPKARPALIDFTLTVRHGTAGFTRASGTIYLTGTWCSRALSHPPVLGGPVSGVLVGAIKR